MKGIIPLAAVLVLTVSALPMLVYGDKDTKVATSGKIISQGIKEDKKIFRIKTDGKIKNIESDEYIIGVLCGEMSPLSEPEALKAQAVAAYTFALKRSEQRKEGDYDLTDSPETDQCYVPKDKAKEKWGESFDTYYNNIKSAVNEVSGQHLIYKGETVLALYHAVSSGVTNNCKDVFGNDLPYLCSVESTGDSLSPKLISEVSLTADEINGKLGVSGDNSFSDISAAKSGLVKSVKYGGKTFKGSEIRKALSLKSQTFSVEKRENNFVFTVKGNGHGVGMSQTGAQYMAQQGSTYKEILFHYYKGTKIIK